MEFGGKEALAINGGLRKSKFENPEKFQNRRKAGVGGVSSTASSKRRIAGGDSRLPT